MHIPDGFIDAKTALAAGGLSAVGLGYALRRAKRNLPARRVPLLGLGAAFLFAAQMINFPIVGGTSGHLIGSTLITGLLGAPAAVIVVSTVVIAQCFLLADGGVTALGANIFNMAILAPAVSQLLLDIGQRVLPGPRGRVTMLAFGAWTSTVIAAVSCAGQFAWSGVVPWKIAFPAMAGIHMIIGLGEAAITAIVYTTVVKMRPELLGDTDAGGQRRGGVLVQALLATVGLALFVSPFACSWPDGLETVAARLGFDHRAIANPTGVLTPETTVTTALVGGLGTLIAFVVAYGLGRALVGAQKPASTAP